MMSQKLEPSPRPSSETVHPPVEITHPIPPETTSKSLPKGSTFWLSYISLLSAVLLAALDLTAVGTALPTIIKELNGSDKFAWVGTAYALANTAVLPLSGNLADIFGRRPVMLISITLFALGSALAGSAQSMEWLIAARTIQGIGGGGAQSLPPIIISDLVPLEQRGTGQSSYLLTWALASAIGPVIGGSLAEKASWRWLFYLNLPISVVAFVFVYFFLRVRTPTGDFWAKIRSVDWCGNIILVAGSTLSNIALTWAGVSYPWSDAHVLAPLILGIFLIGVFIVYERYVPSVPTIPWDILANRTSLTAYGGTFLHGITSISLIYYLPVYFQAARSASPVRSGVDVLPLALIVAPTALVNGLVVKKLKRYLPSNYVGWIFTIVGFGILTMLTADSSSAQYIGFQIVVAIGTGIIFASTIFPILAPLPVQRSASATAFYIFVRTFAQTWGISICANILQNELKRTLPDDFMSQFPSGIEMAFESIDKISSLPEPLRHQVQMAFAESMSAIWKTMIGISCVALFTVPIMREEKMHGELDEKYGLKGSEGKVDPEKV